MGCKAAGTTWNINNACGPGTSYLCSVKWWFKKFYKETRALKMRSAVASHHKLTTTNWIIEADPLITILEVSKELNIDLFIVIWHLKKIGVLQKLDKCVLHELTENPKNHFKVSSSLVLCSNRTFLNQIMMCDKKWILYNNQ